MINQNNELLENLAFSAVYRTILAQNLGVAEIAGDIERKKALLTRDIDIRYLQFYLSAKVDEETVKKIVEKVDRLLSEISPEVKKAMYTEHNEIIEKGREKFKVPVEFIEALDEIKQGQIDKEKDN